MDLVDKLFMNLNLWLVVLTTGVVVYTVRRVVPDSIEGTKWFRVIVNILPLALGASIAMLPGLMPFEGESTQSMAAGFIGGAFSSKTYNFIKSLVSKEMKVRLQGRDTAVGA